MENTELVQEPKTVTVLVNENPVAFTDLKVTGLMIKEAAINQGVKIQLDFNLFEVKEKKMVPVKDDQKIVLHKGQEFRAVTPDDNSKSS